jgi:hypothetical protein
MQRIVEFYCILSCNARKTDAEYTHYRVVLKMSEQFIGFWGGIPVYVEELPKPIVLPSTRDHGKRSSGALVVVGADGEPAANARAAGAGQPVRPAFLKRGMTGGRKHGRR